MPSAPDTAIFERAARDERTIVTADADFGAILALRREKRPSVVLLRRPSDRVPAEQLLVLLRCVPVVADALLEGAIVVVEGARTRIRRLPIGGESPDGA